jgi:hypothetical protein
MSDFKAIGKAFIDFYYNKFDTGPREGVAALYVNFDFIFSKKKIDFFIFIFKGTN